MNIEHVGLYARDSESLADWYSTTLSLQQIQRIDRGEGKAPVVFLRGSEGAVLEILPTEATENPRELNGPGFTHLGLVVEDIHAHVSRLAAMGIEVTGLRSTSNGWTIGYFKDPEGNILELVQR